MRFLCKIDIHKWQEVDFVNFKQTRTCKKCGIEQTFCPGCGGSEIGCWGPSKKKWCEIK